MRVCACVCVWMEMGWPENENVQIDVFHLSPKCLPLLLLLCSQNTFISQSHPVLISQNTPHKRVKPNPYMELTHFNAQIRITLEKLPQTRAHTHARTHMVHVPPPDPSNQFLWAFRFTWNQNVWAMCRRISCVRCAYLLTADPTNSTHSLSLSISHAYNCCTHRCGTDTHT